MIAQDASGGSTGGGSARDRRSNVTLRELLDEMIELARHLTRNSATMVPAELDYARERMEWLAGEIWDVATRTANAG